jgi:hypothetical protein
VTLPVTITVVAMYADGMVTLSPDAGIQLQSQLFTSDQSVPLPPPSQMMSVAFIDIKGTIARKIIVKRFILLLFC